MISVILSVRGLMITSVNIDIPHPSPRPPQYEEDQMVRQWVQAVVEWIIFTLSPSVMTIISSNCIKSDQEDYHHTQHSWLYGLEDEGIIFFLGSEPRHLLLCTGLETFKKLRQWQELFSLPRIMRSTFLRALWTDLGDIMKTLFGGPPAREPPSLTIRLSPPSTLKILDKPRLSSQLQLETLSSIFPETTNRKSSESRDFFSK